MRVPALLLLVLVVLNASAVEFPLPAPRQDEGLPYTRSARPRARQAIGKLIVLYPGSRYAYAHGYRVRLDPHRPLVFGAPGSDAAFSLKRE